MFLFRRVHCWFAVFAVAGFGLQGLVSNTGALSVLFVDLPFPIPYINGRTFHVNVGIYWIFSGLISGILYYFTPISKKRSNYFTAAIFLLYSFGAMLIQGILALHFTVIREYLEGPVTLRAFLLIPLAMLSYYLLRSIGETVKEQGRIISLSIACGVVLLTAFYGTTVYYYTNPGLAEYQRFLTFHIGVESSAELISLGLTGLLLTRLAGIERTEVAFIIFGTICVAVLAMLTASAGYLIWPGNWLVAALAGIGFSMLHLLSAAAFFVLLIKAIQNGLVKKSDYRSVISLTLTASSLLYHIIGAALLGLFLAYPATHQYIKGTYIVSAHSHLALFGVFGFLALSVAVSVLLEFVSLSKNENRRCLGGILLLHGGMLTMAVGLILAGGLQAYLLRVLNVDMSLTDVVLRPYLFLRIGGGILYMLGSLLVAYTILKAVWQQREVVFGYGSSNQGSRNCLYKSYKKLLQKQNELIPVIQRITILQKIQAVLHKLAKR